MGEGLTGAHAVAAVGYEEEAYRWEKASRLEEVSRLEESELREF